MAMTAVTMVEEARAAIDNVSPKQAHDEAMGGEVTFLDVREPIEWERHIGGAVQIARGTLEFKADPESPRHTPELDPSARVIVYCRSGSRSALATVTLQAIGYVRVSNLDGGINGWIEAGLPVVEHHEGM